MEEEGIPYFVVATKADKMKLDEINRACVLLREQYELSDEQPLPFSSITGLGKKKLWYAIRAGILGELEGGEVQDDGDEEGGEPDEEFEEGI